MARILMVDGAEVQGNLLSWDLPGRLIFQSEQGKREIDSAEVDRLVLGGRKEKVAVGVWTISLLDGTRITGQIVGGDGERIAARHALIGDITLPLDAIARIERAETAEKPPSNVIAVKPDQDLIVLQSGDAMSASITELSGSGAKMEIGERERFLDWEKIKYVRLANEKSEGSRVVRVRLLDGAVLIGSKLECKDDRAVLVMVGGQRVKLGAEVLSEIEPLGGRRAWLSELPVHTSVDIPYFERKWPMQVDANAVGGPLSIDGKSYHRGLGLHSAGRWTWQLAGEYERFRGRLGIDDSAGEMADADFFVALDGKQIFELRGIKHGMAAKMIELDVSGGRELAIEVGFGKNGPVQDRVDLVDAALIKSQEIQTSKGLDRGY